MIEGKGHLQAVRGELPRAEETPGRVDQDVKLVMVLPDLGRQSADAGLRRQVGEEHLDSLVPGVATQFGCHLLPFLTVAGDHQEATGSSNSCGNST